MWAKRYKVYSNSLSINLSKILSERVGQALKIIYVVINVIFIKYSFLLIIFLCLFQNELCNSL